MTDAELVAPAVEVTVVRVKIFTALAPDACCEREHHRKHDAQLPGSHVPASAGWEFASRRGCLRVRPQGE